MNLEADKTEKVAVSSECDAVAATCGRMPHLQFPCFLVSRAGVEARALGDAGTRRLKDNARRDTIGKPSDAWQAANDRETEVLHLDDHE